MSTRKASNLSSSCNRPDLFSLALTLTQRWGQSSKLRSIKAFDLLQTFSHIQPTSSQLHILTTTTYIKPDHQQRQQDATPWIYTPHFLLHHRPLGPNLHRLGPGTSSLTHLSNRTQLTNPLVWPPHYWRNSNHDHSPRPHSYRACHEVVLAQCRRFAHGVAQPCTPPPRPHAPRPRHDGYNCASA